jgi:hypothetical protein
MYKIKDNHLYINGERLPFRLNTEIIDETNLAFGFVCATYEGFYNIKTINKSNELADYITLDLDKDKYMPHFKLETTYFNYEMMQDISKMHGMKLNDLMNDYLKNVTIIIPKENIALNGVFEKELKLRQLKNQMNKIEKDFE